MLGLQTEMPAGSAKLTIEGLEYWKSRLTQKLAHLASDVAASEGLSERWCGKCTEGLHELKALEEKAGNDLEAVNTAISAIKHELACASVVAKQPGTPMLRFPSGSTTHKMTPADVASATGNTREVSRNVARRSAILVNSSSDTARTLRF